MSKNTQQKYKCVTQHKESKNQERKRQLSCAKWNTAGKKQGEEGGGGIEGARTKEEENKRKKLNSNGKSRELREMMLRFALQHLWG